MNYTEYTTLTSVCADYDNYAKKMNAEGKKAVSLLSYAFGNMQ